MNNRKDGGPAFPQNEASVNNGHDGMSLRDYFAAHAPDSERENFYNNDPHDGMGWRYRYADAMLRAKHQ